MSNNPSTPREPFAIVESFYYYMWNAWGQDECYRLNFHCTNDHIWNKWCHYYDKYGPNAAIAPFFGELDHQNRKVLVDRSLELYDGSRNL